MTLNLDERLRRSYRAELEDIDYSIRIRNEDIARLIARRAVVIEFLQRLERDDGHNELSTD